MARVLRQKKTSIPRSTIRFWISSSRNSLKIKRGRKTKLSNKQEEEILQLIMCKRTKGDPVHEKDLHDKVVLFFGILIVLNILSILKKFVVFFLYRCMKLLTEIKRRILN